MEGFYYLGAEGGLSYVFNELLDDLVVDVCFEQGLANLAHGVGDVGFSDTASAR